MKFSMKDVFSKCHQSLQFLADLVTFTEEILSGKLFFFCVVDSLIFEALNQASTLNFFLNHFSKTFSEEVISDSTAVVPKQPNLIYFFKVNNENTRAICKIYSKFKIKTLEDVTDNVPVPIL